MSENTPMTREEFQMALEELILAARPDLDINTMFHPLLHIEEDLYGKRGEKDNPNVDVGEGYAGYMGGQEV